jgi:hypothetical protein
LEIGSGLWKADRSSIISGSPESGQSSFPRRGLMSDAGHQRSLSSFSCTRDHTPVFFFGKAWRVFLRAELKNEARQKVSPGRGPRKPRGRNASLGVSCTFARPNLPSAAQQTWHEPGLVPAGERTTHARTRRVALNALDRIDGGTASFARSVSHRDRCKRC